MASARKAIVVGGAGALGASVVARLMQASWSVASVDLRKNEQASANIIVANDQEAKVLQEVQDWCEGGHAGSVVHTGGGFAMGGFKDGFDPVNLMWNQNVKSAFLATHLAAHVLDPTGLLVVTGAKAARGTGTTGFAVGYGMAKAATHHLVGDFRQEFPKSRVVCILPTTLDTPANREAMAQEDFSKWTSPDDVAEKVAEWSEDPASTKNLDLFVDV
mmetsp:Transcript_4416/g.7775  ORF Transcript_4416/g.7775 Transcript_4416/m.7775 type:complete len:217 (+) Transcript_4416:333-983(+)|eukprot:CAMPEP_0184525604 /NCGR_PEP_ID=MMETSP0198_2-20121128/10197_1 /TAXON_ID=1112570 /ORGANISM="Thraustochytrium sp., Strain LLF1b" /LENGTH=216 /DNA_ID=CAMNT_0026917095 /DNA_START=394 /DNA_END=1044 /DNA_ORIENTATION=-